jgi:Ran GTPase-activating protein (RanGAP) involved in mRNA processing and transport
MSLIALYLAKNDISEIPINFFPNVQILDLQCNKLGTKAAYNISNILQNQETKWTDLNLNDNEIKTEGFISIIYALVLFLSVIFKA